MAKQLVTKHVLIPKHTKISEKEKKELFEKYHLTFKEIPKIKKSDSAIAGLNVKAEDIIKIVRDSPTSGKSIFYRGVIHG